MASVVAAAAEAVTVRRLPVAPKLRRAVTARDAVKVQAPVVETRAVAVVEQPRRWQSSK